jgi:hypothetical protein
MAKANPGSGYSDIHFFAKQSHQVIENAEPCPMIGQNNPKFGQVSKWRIAGRIHRKGVMYVQSVISPKLLVTDGVVWHP